MKRLLIVGLIAALLSGTLIATSEMRRGATTRATTTWMPGDLFLAVGGGSYQVRQQDGTLKETLTSGLGGLTTGCLVHPSGVLYATHIQVSTVVKFAGPNDPHTPTSFGSGHLGPESIVLDAAGNVYVGNLGNGIRKYDSAGNFLATVINTRVDWFDIAPDQDTILYTQELTDIKRVSITSGPLSNFATGTASFAFGVRILPDGTVLLTNGPDVQRYSAGGSVIQTYDVAGEDGWFSLIVDPNDTSFWVGSVSSSNYYKLNIATGAVEAGPFSTGTASQTFNGMCMMGELPVALDADGDGILTVSDNCPDLVNPLQTDTDTDVLGDDCETPLEYGTNPANPDTDGDGCVDGREVRTLTYSPQMGGHRDPLNGYDFYDVNSSRKVDAIDVGQVRAKFNTSPPDPNYAATHDRSPGAAPWAPGPPDVVINGIDINLARASFNHTCQPPP